MLALIYEGELSEETMGDIEQSLEDVKASGTLSVQQVKQRLKSTENHKQAEDRLKGV